MFLSTPSGPPAKSVKNPLYPLVFIKIPQNPHFLGGGRVELRKPLHVECWEDVHCLGWRGIVECICLYSIIVFFICVSKSPSPQAVYGRGTLYMKWRAASYMALVWHGSRLASSISESLENHNLTSLNFSHFHDLSSSLISFTFYQYFEFLKYTQKT